MPEHLIHLRRAWEGHFPQAGGAVSVHRVSLPTNWPLGLVRPFRLIRSFQAPPIDADRESLRLILTNVWGLVSVRLNGDEVARPDRVESELAVSLERPLPRRNLLELEVDPLAWPVQPPTWGHIALAISPA